MSDRRPSKEQTVEDAFAEWSDAKKVREAIAYLKTMTSPPVGDSMAQWADEEVMDAAGKYADYLETRAYKGPDADLIAVVRRGVESGTIKGEVYESGDEYGGLALLPRGVFLVIPVDVGEA